MLSAGAGPLEGSIVPDARTKGPPAAPGVAVKAEDVPKLEETVGNHVLVLVSRPPPGPRICPNFTSHRRNGRRKVFDVRAGRRASLQQGLDHVRRVRLAQRGRRASSGGGSVASASRRMELPCAAWSTPSPSRACRCLHSFLAAPQGSASTRVEGSTTQDRARSLAMTAVYTLFLIADYWTKPVQNCGGLQVSGLHCGGLS